jgi:hypothetical protein
VHCTDHAHFENIAFNSTDISLNPYHRSQIRTILSVLNLYYLYFQAAPRQLLVSLVPLGPTVALSVCVHVCARAST